MAGSVIVELKTNQVGRGVSFPFRFSMNGINLTGEKVRGRTAFSEGDERISEIVQQVFGTIFGSRVMERSIGFLGHELVFYPITESLGEQLVYYGNLALDSFQETRVRILSAETDVSQMDSGFVTITMKIFIVQTREIAEYPHRLYLPGL